MCSEDLAQRRREPLPQDVQGSEGPLKGWNSRSVASLTRKIESLEGKNESVRLWHIFWVELGFEESAWETKR